jgi:hypothetical protein
MSDTGKKFVIGDVVRCKGQRKTMTVIDIGDDWKDECQHGKVEVWADESGRHWLPGKALELAAPAVLAEAQSYALNMLDSLASEMAGPLDSEMARKEVAKVRARVVAHLARVRAGLPVFEEEEEKRALAKQAKGVKR